MDWYSIWCFQKRSRQWFSGLIWQCVKPAVPCLLLKWGRLWTLRFGLGVVLMHALFGGLWVYPLRAVVSTTASPCAQNNHHQDKITCVNSSDTTCHHKIIQYWNEMFRKWQEKFQLLNLTVWTYWGAQTLTQTADCLLIFQMENIFRSASFAFTRSLPHPSLSMPGWKSILHPSNGSRWWASWVSGNLQDLKGWKKDFYPHFLANVEVVLQVGRLQNIQVEVYF